MDAIRYLARIKADNTRVEVRVNDIPVGTFHPGEARDTAEVPVNEFLVSGANRLSVIFHANRRPTQVLQPWNPLDDAATKLGQPASLEVQVVREDPGRASGATVQSVSWSGPAAPLPVRGERDFQVHTAPPAWVWTRAQRLQGDAAGGAFRVLAELHRMLAAGETARLLAVMAVKLREITTGAYGVPEANLRNGLLQALGTCAGDPAWILQPCAAGDVDLRLVGGDRLVECMRPDGLHALTYIHRETHETFFLPAMLGIADGAWQVLR